MPSERGRIRVAVVDAHPLYRAGVVAMLERQPEFQMVANVATGADALRVSRIEKPDVMLIDTTIREGGAALIIRLIQERPDLRIVVLTESESDGHVTDVLQAGACGYLLKVMSGSDLVSALRLVARGESYVMPELAAKVLAAMRQRPHTPSVRSLNAREEGILRQVAGGATNKEIARKLNINEKTVKNYMTGIMQKLQVRNRVEAASRLLDGTIKARLV